MQYQVWRCQQLHTRTIDARDGGMVAMAYIEATQALTIALGARNHHPSRDEMRRAFASTKTVVRDLTQDIELRLVALITDDTNHIPGLKNSIGCHQFIGAIVAYDTADQHRMDRAAVVQLTKGHILLYRQTNIHAYRLILGGILHAQALILRM